MRYVKEGPKVDSSSVSSPNSMEPQYATCDGAAVTVEHEYATGLYTFSSIKHVVNNLQFVK